MQQLTQMQLSPTEGAICLAGKVAEMSPTRRPDWQMSPDLERHHKSADICPQFVLNLVSAGNPRPRHDSHITPLTGWHRPRTMDRAWHVPQQKLWSTPDRHRPFASNIFNQLNNTIRHYLFYHQQRAISASNRSVDLHWSFIFFPLFSQYKFAFLAPTFQMTN